MRTNIEPITQSNLVNISTDNLEAEISFYQKYTTKRPECADMITILGALQSEMKIRDLWASM
jgi:hypothetical protein